MSGAIETFVARLQADGVEAGKRDGDQIRSAAKADAEKILAEARAEAERLRAAAERDAQRSVTKAKVELDLAVRDTIARLRAQLVAAIEAVMASAARDQLRDAGFIAKLLDQIVSAYAAAHIANDKTLIINVSADTHRDLLQWALSVLMAEREKGRELKFDLFGSLQTAGFEYRLDNAAVEVTQESVVEVLSQMVAPELRAIIEGATGADSDDAGDTASDTPNNAATA